MDRKYAKTFYSSGVKQTENMAELIGAKLKGSELIELVSDLGGGKTTFVKGLTKGAGSVDHVSSPSFTLRNDYTAPKLTIAHFDFYRLNDAGILKEMLAEAVTDPTTVVVIEWAGIVNDVLSSDKVKISIKVTGENSRTFELDYPERFKYLFQGINL